MGLKMITFAPYKSGKTVFGLTMAELGPIGIVDTEQRIQWYTTPHPSVKPAAFPYDKPRALRPDLAFFPQNSYVVHLVETMEIAVAGRAIEAWTKDPDIFGVTLDSGSILWDLLQDTRDESDPKTAMLSWTPVKRTNRRLFYALMSGGKHVVVSSHSQDVYKKVGRELTVTGVRPWLEKKSPHWCDLVLEFAFPDGAAAPGCRVAGEGIGGAGGLTKGKIIGDPTFKKILDKIVYIPQQAPLVDPDELEHRNRSVVEEVGKSTPIKGVDDTV